MSSAFSKEPDGNEVFDDLPDRPVSPHRNLVTSEGLAAIGAEVERLRIELAHAEEQKDRNSIARVSRDLRYWNARATSAEHMDAPEDKSVVRFGHSVGIEWSDGRKQTYRIVGEDEADPTKGTLPFVAPLAVAMLGKTVGDTAKAPHGEFEIISIA